MSLESPGEAASAPAGLGDLVRDTEAALRAGGLLSQADPRFDAREVQ